MRACCLFALALFPLLSTFFSDASAQEAPSEASVELEAPRERLSYEEYRWNELNYLAKRSRKALISTSAAAAVGISLVAPAAVKECVRVASSSSFDDLRCSSTGAILLGIGVPILVAGATGVLVTAIMLGVRKGKARNLEDRMAYEESRAVRWDPARAVFVF